MRGSLRRLSGSPRLLRAGAAAAVACLGLTPTDAAAQACLPAGFEMEDVRTWFAEAAAMDAEARRLWGLPVSGPLLLVDRGTRSAVANRRDAGGAFVACGDVFVGTLPAELSAGNTSFDWEGGRWTMVLAPLSRDGYDRRRLLGHEQFHRIQPALGLDLADPPNAHLASLEGRIWLRLEMRALAEALIRRGDERRGAVADALAFRAKRRSLFPDAAAQEDALERNEGLAEYTGLRLSGLPSHVLADRAAVRLEDAEGSDNLARSFAYATGPAYGLLLDESGADWRPRARAGAGLADLLAEAYAGAPPSPASSPASAETRAADYDGAHLMAFETRRAERIAARVAELRAKFVEGPVLRLPVGAEFRYSFDPRDAEPLDGEGTVYGSSRVTDEWGVLTVDGGGVLLRRNDEGHITGIVVSLSDSATPPLEGSGWTLDLAAGWEAARDAGGFRVRRTAAQR